jgi:hypothetical protein
MQQYFYSADCIKTVRVDTVEGLFRSKAVYEVLDVCKTDYISSYSLTTMTWGNFWLTIIFVSLGIIFLWTFVALIQKDK